MDTGKSAIGLDGNVAAALGYPIVIVAIISLIMEKENRFVKFHAWQAVLLCAAGIVLSVVCAIVLTILSVLLALARVGELSALLWLLYMLVFLAWLGGLIFAAVKAFGGNYFKLPIIGNMAEKFANK